MVYSVIATGAMSAARMAPRHVTRALSTSAVLKKDIVQEAYIRELHSYKAPAKASDAHVGQVREFVTPKAPQAPSTPSSSDLSSELDSFASSEPDHAEHDATSEGGAAPAPREDVNAFLEEARKPYEKEAHH
ncbi:hypothetical protein CBS101457_000510 [Exobasidium rhododendri]|nr:hypothetical protein CBS101457_000510 [Exobasidium rhododendri]